MQLELSRSLVHALGMLRSGKQADSDHLLETNRKFSNMLLSHYQMKLNRILDEGTSQAILYFHWIWCRFVERPEHQTIPEIDVHAALKELAKGQGLKLILNEAEIQSLVLRNDIILSFEASDNSFKLDVNKFCAGLDLKGEIDSHLFWLIKSHWISIDHRQIDRTTSFLEDDQIDYASFWKTFDHFQITSERLDALFFALLKNESSEFLDFIEKNIYSFFLKRNKLVRVLAMDLLTRSLTFLKYERHCKASLLLDCLLNKSRLMSLSSPKVPIEKYDSFIRSDVIINSPVLFISYPVYLKGRYSRVIERAFDPNHVDIFANTLLQGVIQLSLCDRHLNVHRRINLMNVPPLHRNIIALNQVDVEGKDLENSLLVHQAFCVKFSNSHIIDSDFLKSLSAKLKTHNKSFYLQLSIAKLKSVATDDPEHTFFGQLANPKYSIESLLKLSKWLVCMLKEINLSGIIIENVAHNFTTLDFATFNSTNAHSISKEHMRLMPSKSIDTLFADQNFLNPFCGHLFLKLISRFPRLHFVTSEAKQVMASGGKYLVDFYDREYFNNDNIRNFVNYLNSHFRLDGMLNSEDLSIIVKKRKSKNPAKNAMLNKFYAFIESKFCLANLSKNNNHSELRQLSQLNIHSTPLSVMSAPYFIYMPVIILADSVQYHNEIIAGVTFTGKKLVLYFEPVFPHPAKEITIRISLRGVYRDMKCIPAFREVIDNFLAFDKFEGATYHSVYEFLNSEFELQVKDQEIRLSFSIVDSAEPLAHEIVWQKCKLFDDKKGDLRLLQIRDFFKLLNKGKFSEEDILQNFIMLLDDLGVNSPKRFSRLLHLPQIKNHSNRIHILLFLLQKIKLAKPKVDVTRTSTNSQIKEMIDSQHLNTIAVITPEFGQFVKVGGLAVMIEDLVFGLAAQKERLVVFLPLYHDNGKCEEVIAKFSLKQCPTIEVGPASQTVELEVFTTTINEVNFVLFKNQEIFPKIYSNVRLLERPIPSGSANNRVQLGQFEDDSRPAAASINRNNQ